MSVVSFFLGYSNRPINQISFESAPNRSKSKPTVAITDIDVSDDYHTTDDDDEDMLSISDCYADVDADEQHYYYYSAKNSFDLRTTESDLSTPRSKIIYDDKTISQCSSARASPVFSADCASITDTLGSMTTIASTATVQVCEIPLVDASTLARHDQILSHLNLELHATVVELFKPGADTNRYGLLDFEYQSVEQLLRAAYLWLEPGTREYVWHYERLQRNRKKIEMLQVELSSYKEIAVKRWN